MIPPFPFSHVLTIGLRPVAAQLGRRLYRVNGIRGADS